MEDLDEFNPFFPNYTLGDKHVSSTKGRRSFSTSTPIPNKPVDTNESRRSLSVSVCSLNDSGYAESLCSVAGSDDISDITSSIEVPILHIGSNDTGYHGSQTQINHFTAFQPKVPEQSVVDKLSLDFSFHNLDFEIPEEENLFSDKPESRCSLDLEELDYKFKSGCDIPKSSECSISPRTLDNVWKKFLPEVPDRLIGKKILVDHVDIISELQDRNMGEITAKIMDYLSLTDLCSMCQVSRRWKEVCEGSRRNKARKLSYIKQRNSASTGKENIYKKLQSKARRGLTGGNDSLATIQYVPEGQIPTEPVCKQPCLAGTQRENFAKAAENLKNDERLQKCPSCQHPSIVSPVQERGKCQYYNCKFDYCTKCFSDFHGSSPCVPVCTGRQKTASIGSKRSKKNLRRL